MPYYSDEDEDIDVRIHRGHHSPFDYAPRPPFYQSRSGQLLEIASQRRTHSRPRSRERRSPSPAVPAPVIINNRIYNDHEDEYYEEEPRYLPVAAPQRHRSRSRSRPQSPPDPRQQGWMTREDFELERTRKELERLKMEAQKEEDEKQWKKELELKRLKEEKRAEEEKEKAKIEADRAVKEWKAKQEKEEKRQKEEKEAAIKEYKAIEAEKREKEREEKEQREKEYQRRLTDDLRKSGVDERQIALILKKDHDGAKDVNRPTYTRMARKFLSLETLNVNRIDYTIDTNPDYVLIKRWVPEYEQDFLWNHTKELRERRYHLEHHHSREVLLIEEKKEKKHQHHLGAGEYDYEIVRKEKKRSKSPAPMLTFFAGAKRG